MRTVLSHPSRVRGLKYRILCVYYTTYCVAPLAGAWIEMATICVAEAMLRKSHPSRVRGLKYQPAGRRRLPEQVAPLAGAWIEMRDLFLLFRCVVVAPLAGAWIEMPPQRLGRLNLRVAPLAGAWIEILRKSGIISGTKTSHPSRVRGLKCQTVTNASKMTAVAPLAGAWIGITFSDSARV